MASRFERQGKKGTIYLSGDLTIAYLDEPMDTIQKALKSSDQVKLNINDIGSIDVAFLQMICSAHQTAQKLNKEIMLSDEVSPVYHEFLAESGFLRNSVCRIKKIGPCFFRPREHE